MSLTIRPLQRLRLERPASGETSLPRSLLGAGIAAVALYVVGDLVAGLLYGGYSFRDQAISELAAFGSPVRPLMVTVFTGVFTLLVVAAIVLSAIAHPGRFRWFSIGMLVVLAGFGAASAVAIQGIERNATAWAGGLERINAYAYFAWLIALALVLLRTRTIHTEKDEPETLSLGRFDPYQVNGHETREPIRSR